jgi:glycine/D-amino acid oxidase-like deaminating enzyme
MITAQSPWLAQLNLNRQIVPHAGKTRTDITIVGAGISGVVTAYYILTRTKHNVILVEADRVAHGATGHNAGFLATDFERSFSDIVKEYGIGLAGQGLHDVESAWGLLETIVNDCNLTTPLHLMTRYEGYTTYEQVLHALEYRRLRATAGLASEPLLIAAETTFIDQLPHGYEAAYNLVPQAEILELLEIADTHYIAASPGRGGVMNSALFVEELLNYIRQAFPGRLQVFEQSPIRRLIFKADYALAESSHGLIISDTIVLCTNGFEKFSIVNHNGPKIDRKFHHMVEGVIGYMAGYFEPREGSPALLSYYENHRPVVENPFRADSYFYLSRRPYEHQGGTKNLICVGGPEMQIEDTTSYVRHEHPYPETAKAETEQFLAKSYGQTHPGLEAAFFWHGLMGYTPTGIRLIGPESCQPRLLYNLGCNGIGIMPSIFGAKKISSYLRGEVKAKSIFDPSDTRCVLPPWYLKKHSQWRPTV